MPLETSSPILFSWSVLGPIVQTCSREKWNIWRSVWWEQRFRQAKNGRKSATGLVTHHFGSRPSDILRKLETGRNITLQHIACALMQSRTSTSTSELSCYSQHHHVLKRFDVEMNPTGDWFLQTENPRRVSGVRLVFSSQTKTDPSSLCRVGGRTSFCVTSKNLWDPFLCDVSVSLFVRPKWKSRSATRDYYRFEK